LLWIVVGKKTDEGCLSHAGLSCLCICHRRPLVRKSLKHSGKMSSTATETDHEIGKQLQYRDQSELLDAIDELSRRGLRNYVSLPQIIVCGDQSSGKSSVLEAISHVRFPTNGTLCTTFATELVVRRSPSNGASVCILPGASRSHNQEAITKLQSFPSGNDVRSEPTNLSSLVEAATQAMKDASKSTGNPFFDDTLRIQLCKPDWPPITIVDLPGLIHAENQDQTQDDVKLVRDLVNRYMENPRSIILAIVSAENDAALQIVLSLAKVADPDRKRTMGIITKPDTLEFKGPESMNSFLKLARNESESHQFKLGWHVLKNRDPRSLDLSAAERDAAEISFFSKPPWSSFDDQNCLGIDKLRLRLSRVLHERIASSLPDIIEEIRTETAKAEADLQKLGTDRSSRKSKEAYLIGVAQHFQMLAQSAVDGTWSDQFDPFFKNPYGADGYGKRLRAVVQNLNDQFSDLMHSRGRQWTLDVKEKEVTRKLFPMKFSAGTSPDKTSQTPFSVYPGIDQFTASENITREEFMLKIKHLSSATRGRELSGAFNHNTIGELFREQSQRWTKLAEHHVETVWNAVRFFLEAAFEALADPRTLNAIMIDIVDPMMADKKNQARQKLEEILVPHTKLHPISYNSKLLKSVHDAKYKRELERIQQEAALLIQASKSRTLSEDDLASIVQQSTNHVQDGFGDKFGSSDILDYTDAYYEVRIIHSSFIYCY
jgi:GTP-binding protein EngB required for normal cell division